MGFLAVDSDSLTWDEAKKYQFQIKYYGILQAIKLYETFKDIHKEMDELKWGDEMEYSVGTLCQEDYSPQVVVKGYDKVKKAVKDINQDVFEIQSEF
jgi:hypothetical protein